MRLNTSTLRSRSLVFACSSILISCHTTASTPKDSEALVIDQNQCPELAGNPLAPEAELQEIPLPSKFDFLEGPTWIAERNTLIFSAWTFTSAKETAKSPPPTTILAKTDNEWSDFGQKGQFGTNGLAISPDGRSIVAALSDRQELGYITLDEKRRVPITQQFEGKKFNSPNDLVVRSDGTIYFTDPDYQRGQREGQGRLTGVYRVDPKGQVSLVDGARLRPNGLTLSPDEKWLYVGSAEGKVFRYSVAKNGDLSKPEVWAEPGFDVDGVSRDCAGNIYAAIHTESYMLIYNPEGKQIGKLDVPYKITNIAFGDKDRKTIYITTTGHLYAIRGQLPGHPY